MSTQYLRNLSLVVADAAGKGFELGAFRVVFTVQRGDIQTPNSCDVRVYNLANSTANAISGPEFTQLSLKVSYGSDPPQQIFRGTITQVRQGREDQKNSYVAITAGAGDAAYNFSAIALTLAAGSNPPDSIAAVIASMTGTIPSTPTDDTGGEAVSLGLLPDFNKSGLPRGRTHYGMCRDELRDLASANDCTWWIGDDGAINFVPVTGYLPGAPVLITPFTGLIGVPEQTLNGLEMVVLMNPNIKIGQTVKLDSSVVNQYRFGLDLESQKYNPAIAASVAKLNADGLYYVMRADHAGDTRGNAWYTHLTCLAVDASVPLNAAQANVPATSAVPVQRY